MQPFLLAFVDSQAFQIFSAAFLLPFLLAGAVVVWLVVALTRSGLRGLRSPATATNGWQFLGSAACLLPAALIGLLLLLVGLSGAVDTIEAMNTSGKDQDGTVYQEALHHKEMRHQAQVAGRYVLADEVPAELNSAWHTKPNGLLDTTRLPTGRATPSQPPRAELWLRPDGTFAYYSTIAGDEAGAEANGYWRLQGSTWYTSQTLEDLRQVHSYAILFEFVLPIIGGASPLSGFVSDKEELAITLAGSYNRAGSSASFALTQAPAPLAPPGPPALLASSL